MATVATAGRRDLKVKEQTFLWEGVDRNNRQVRGETKAASETVVRTNLRRQGIRVDRDAFLLGVHDADQIVRPGQAAGMGGQETVTAALHGLNSRAQL